jgi:hypothetical protein
MNKSHRPLLNIFCRRRFIGTIAGWAAGEIFARQALAIEQPFPLKKSSPEFLVVNGWVLTREDMAGSTMEKQAARLQ